MKDEYIKKITEQINKCDNLAILDLVYQIMKKAGATHG